MSTYFLTLPSSKDPLHSFLESLKTKIFLESNSENASNSEEEAENFLKNALASLGDSFLSMMKFLFSFKERLQKEQKIYGNMMSILAINIATAKNIEEREVMVKEYVDHVHELPTEHFFNLKAKMLSALFNSFSVRDPKQFDLFKEILQLTEAQKKVSIIMPTIENIDDYLRSWGLFNNLLKKREIYQQILNALYNNNREKTAIDIFIKYLKTFEESQEQDMNNLQETNFIVSNIKRFLASESYHYEVFECIIRLKRVSQLQEKRLSEILMLYVTGNLHGYIKWLETNRDFLEKELGIDAKKIEVKIRIKCLSSFEETGKPVSFKEMAEKLHVKEDEVEDWVIMGIQSKIIEGKIDEFQKVIEIVDNSSKFIEKADVEKIEQKLGVLIGVFEGYLDSLKKKKQI